MTTSVPHSLEALANFLQQAYRRYDRAVSTPQPPSSPDDQPDRCSEPFMGFIQTRPTYNLPDIDAAWQRASQIFANGQVISAIVTGWNRGGLLVRWDELQGFVPASQLKDIPIFEDDNSRDEKLARWVGEELRLKVIELDRGRNRLVFSERATIWGPKDGERVLSEVIPGEIRRGYVSNLCDFGAFVDLGGIDGLIHVSELSWGRVTHPREILAIGQEVQVYVISVDLNNRRVALSLKRLRSDPWTLVNTKYYVGQVLQATITNIVDFGAFARIEDGLEGLIHISELSEEQISHPSEVIRPGSQVEVRILRIDSVNHRLGLSIRQVTEQVPKAKPQQPSVPTDWAASL